MTNDRVPRVLAVTLLGVLCAADARSQGACETAPYRAFDYLLGEWRLVDDAGVEIGGSSWRRDAGGCVLVEDFRDPRGAEVHGVLYRDPVSGDWHGSWVDGSGNVVRVQGRAEEGRATLQGDAASPQGAAMARVTFERAQSPGEGIGQLLEMSTDGGTTWNEVSKARYHALGARAPARPTPTRRRERSRSPEPTATPTPTPEPEASRPTIERSAREADVPAPAPAPIRVLSEASKDPSPDPIRMASPMQLQIEVGPVENLPEGYGWSSTDTAPYVAENVSIQRVVVEQRRRGGRGDLAVTLHVHGAVFVVRADVTVELLDASGEVVAAQEATGVAVGRGIPTQSEKGAVAQSFRFALQRDAFDSLFAAPERPQLRFTVTVRD